MKSDQEQIILEDKLDDVEINKDKKVFEKGKSLKHITEAVARISARSETYKL